MVKIKTRLTEMLGIDYPIIGAPMFLVSYADLTAAVSAAGGLGAFPLPNFRTLDELKQTLISIKSRTDRPIGVNIHVSGRFPWQEQLDLCLAAGVKFFITSLGDPRLILDAVHARGGVVFADVVNLEQALKARDRGVDGLIAVGSGAGGHCGHTPTLILTPYLAARTGLPVLAAGGISTGAQMAAALAVGAAGVVVGTRLIATDEAQASAAYKQAVLAAGPADIVCSDRLTGNPANWLRASIDQVDQAPAIASKRWRDLWSAGQSVAQVEAVMPAGAVVAEMVRDFVSTCRALQQTLADDGEA